MCNKLNILLYVIYYSTTFYKMSINKFYVLKHLSVHKTCLCLFF